MDITHQPSQIRPVARHVAPAAVFEWLRLGWRDLRKAPGDSLFYGAAFVLMGYLLTLYFSLAPEFVITLSTLFLLAGPFLAIGLYDIARQLEYYRGSRIDLAKSMTAWRHNLPSFTLYAALLAVLVFGWFRVSLLMFALFYETAVPTFDALLADLFNPANLSFLVAYFGTGFLFATLVFALSAVSIPMMLDREVDAITAMIASLQAVYRNLLTMLVWAGMIVLLTAIGFATYFIGLMITVPLIGLATWHAYRALIAYER